jgi:hypothetical protein
LDRVCTDFGIDSFGRPDSLGSERRQVWNQEASSWVTRSQTNRTYGGFSATTPRLNGRQSAQAHDRLVPTPMDIVDWQLCTRAETIDVDGRVTCTERPSASSLKAMFDETSSNITTGAQAGGVLRVINVKNAAGTSMMKTFRVETAEGRLVTKGSGAGRRRQTAGTLSSTA